MAKVPVSDTGRLDWLESHGDGAALVSDDAGHWAVSWDGAQDVPTDPPQDIVTTHIVERDQWRPSIRAAIDAAMAGQGEGPTP